MAWQLLLDNFLRWAEIKPGIFIELSTFLIRLIMLFDFGTPTMAEHQVVDPVTVEIFFSFSMGLISAFAFGRKGRIILLRVERIDADGFGIRFEDDVVCNLKFAQLLYEKLGKIASSFRVVS